MKKLLTALAIAASLTACGGGSEDEAPPAEFKSTMACFKNPGPLVVGTRVFIEDCSVGLTPIDKMEYKVHYRDTDGVIRSTFFGGPVPQFVVFNKEQVIIIEWCVVRTIAPMPIVLPGGGIQQNRITIDCVKEEFTAVEK